MSMDRGIAEGASWRESHGVSNTWWDWILAGLRTVSKRGVEGGCGGPWSKGAVGARRRNAWVWDWGGATVLILFGGIFRLSRALREARRCAAFIQSNRVVMLVGMLDFEIFPKFALAMPIVSARTSRRDAWSNAS